MALQVEHLEKIRQNKCRHVKHYKQQFSLSGELYRIIILQELIKFLFVWNLDHRPGKYEI